MKSKQTRRTRDLGPILDGEREAPVVDGENGRDHDTVVNGTGTARAATVAHGENSGQRDGRGRFTAGNVASRGNRGRRREGAIRRAIERCVSGNDFDAVVRRALAHAKQGDEKARRFLAEYHDGKPRLVDRDALHGVKIPPVES